MSFLSPLMSSGRRSALHAEHLQKERENQPERCTRGAGVRHLHCPIDATLECLFCPDHVPICEAHNFGTKEHPMCFDCAQETEHDDMQAAARMVERAADLEIDYPEVA